MLPDSGYWTSTPLSLPSAPSSYRFWARWMRALRKGAFNGQLCSLGNTLSGVTSWDFMIFEPNIEIMSMTWIYTQYLFKSPFKRQPREIFLFPLHLSHRAEYSKQEGKTDLDLSAHGHLIGDINADDYWKYAQVKKQVLQQRDKADLWDDDVSWPDCSRHRLIR